MASVFKPKNRNGKKAAVWKFKYLDYTGKRKGGTGWPDKKRTLEHAQALEAEHRAIRKGEKEIPPDWLKLRNKPIQEFVDEYLESGRTHGGIGGRPWAKAHYRNRKRLLAFWVKEMGLQTLADISSAKVERVARKLLSDHSGKTVSNYLEAMTGLCHWATKRGMLARYPLAAIGRFDKRPVCPHRALADNEVRSLMGVAPPARKLLYKTALETGYRAGELRALKVHNLDRFSPALTLSGDFTKNKEDASQPITRELADELAELAGDKPADARLLKMPKMQTLAENLGRDFQKAGITRKTVEGRATFHSFRVNYINCVVESGSDLKTIMTLARHKSAQMSMEAYAKPNPKRLRAAAQAVAAHVKEVISEKDSCPACVPQAVGSKKKSRKSLA